MPRPPSIPKPYVKSGQLAVNLRDPRSRRRYAEVIAAWEAADRAVEPPEPRKQRTVRRPATTTVTQVIVAYWIAMKPRYMRDGKPTSTGFAVRSALRRLRQHSGTVVATEFGPRRLRTYRDSLVASGGLGRDAINRDSQVIVRMFKWAVSDELVPAVLHQALACVEPLHRGEVSGLREPRRVEPVSDAAIEAILPLVPRQVAALIRLQRFTGARAGELVGLRAIDLETSSDVWLYRPDTHKTAHHGHRRTIPLGPKCQEVLRPFLTGRPVDRPLFSPAEAAAEQRARRTAARVTPASCGNAPGTNRVESPKRRPKDAYTTASYRRCIERACDQAFPPTGELARVKVAAKKRTRWETEKEWRRRLGRRWAQVEAWRRDHRWTPHQLRHTAATEFRQRFGLETAALILGHSSPTITDAVYAERDLRRVLQAMNTAG